MESNWTLLALPLFSRQFETLRASVLRAERAHPDAWLSKASSRLFFQMQEVILDRVPRDPFGTEFRQGNTLGKGNRHWFRAKFGGGRFRVFFRADSTARVIVYAWVNDRGTLRKAGSNSDPYVVFAGMLAAGDPPTEWPALVAAARPFKTAGAD